MSDTDPRKPIFDAARKAKGAGFTAGQVAKINTALDDAGVPKEIIMVISQKGIDLIKKFEGVRLKAYLDTGGVPTIGVGHTKGVKMGQTITEAQADQFLRDDLATAMEAVRRLFPVTTQGQFDSLTSFVFNLGEGQVKTSTLRRMHNEGDYAGAKAQFARWKFDNGKELAGLVKRRAAEAELYAS